MLPQIIIAPKVEIAVIAGPMKFGILVLLEGTIVGKLAFALVTVYNHGCGELKKGVSDPVSRSDSESAGSKHSSHIYVKIAWSGRELQDCTRCFIPFGRMRSRL